MMESTHSKLVGYLLWGFGFTGSHRFYYGRPFSGTLYFFTLGLFGIGWLVDFFFIPEMDRKADLRYNEGVLNYSLAWVFLTYLGVFGIHRFYMRKWLSGFFYLITGGGFLIGVIYDFWTLNEQVAEINRRYY